MKSAVTTFVIIVLSNLNITAQSNDMLDWKKEQIAKLSNHKAYITACIDLLNEADLTFKPVPDEQDSRSLLMHMADNAIWISESYLQGGKYGKRYDHKDLSKEEVKSYIRGALDFAITSLERVNDGEMRTTVDFFAGPKTVRQMVELIDDHFTHHKGALTVYLRLLGQKPPKYVGW